MPQLPLIHTVYLQYIHVKIMARKSLIPDSGHNRARKDRFSDLTTILFRDDQSGLKVPLPDDDRLVGLVPDSQEIPGLVQ
jgi:hypothetical protein